MLTEHSPLVAVGAQPGLAASTPRLANGTSTQAPPRSSRLLHEPRGLLAKGCAYCTNPRTPRSTPNPPPVTPDLRVLRPGEARSQAGNRAQTRTNPRLPRVRVSMTWRRGRDSNPRCARRTAVFKTATFGRSVTSPGRTLRARQAQTLPSRWARGHREPTGRQRRGRTLGLAFEG